MSNADNYNFCGATSLFIFIYSQLQAFTLWNNASSDKLVILNGVRQGSILSPILLSYYMEDLINVIVKRNICCKSWQSFHWHSAVCRRHSADCAMSTIWLTYAVRTLLNINYSLAPTLFPVKKLKQVLFFQAHTKRCADMCEWSTAAIC